jgi:hypothetical protein
MVFIDFHPKASVEELKWKTRLQEGVLGKGGANNTDYC